MYNAVLGIDNTIEGGFESVRQALDALGGAINSMGPASTSGGGSSGGTTGGGTTGGGTTGGGTTGGGTTGGGTTEPALSDRERLINIANESGGVLTGQFGQQVNTDWLAGVPDWRIDQMINGNNWGEIEGFANGGFHTGGWRIVGEEGPELEYTPPSRIYSNSDSSDMFDMSELVAEVKQLREDMRSANYAIAKNTQKTAKTLEKFDYDGLPEQRVV
jgi:hypothetical protein